jgi:hypothetical protein
MSAVASGSHLPLPAPLPFAKGSIQELIFTTLEIPAYLVSLAKGDLCMAYAKYLALNEAIGTVDRMVRNKQWIQRKPSNDDIIKVFMSKSAYFKNHHKIFPMLDRYPAMEKWLWNGGDAPADVEVWRHQKQTFESLKKILSACHAPILSHANTNKGKNIQDESSSSPPAMEKKKEGKGKKKEGSGSKKNRSKKHQST